MKRNSINMTKIINITCALLMLAMLVCQFVPYWNVAGSQASISGYVWFPDDHNDFTEYFRTNLGNDTFYSGSIAGINVLTIVACALGFYFNLRNADDVWPPAVSVLCGAIGLFSYIAYPAYRMGSMWPLHVAGYAVLIVLSLISVLSKLRLQKQQCQQKC